MVGREKELAWLDRLLEASAGGIPRLALLSGEAGLGKTRLLHEAEARARAGRHHVCRGRASKDLQLPYLPFVEILRDQLAEVPEALTRALGRDADHLLAVARGDALLERPGAASELESRRACMRLLLAVSRASIELARIRPTLLVLDDLHWADELTVDQLQQLAFAVSDAAAREPVPLLIVAAHRPVEPAGRLARALSRLRREAICESLELHDHSEAEIAELIAALGIDRPARQLVKAVHRVTRGNPLFVLEVVRHLIEQGALEERGSYLTHAVPIHDLALPTDLLGAITANTSTLHPACRRVLTCAACLPGSFSLEELSAACAAGSKADEDALLDVLDVAISRHLVVSKGERFEFRHPLIRQVFYTMPSALRRQRIHARIARSLKRSSGDRAPERALEIAHHLVRAGSSADPRQVAGYAGLAGDQAFARLSWDDAAHFYEVAAQTAAKLDQPAESARYHFRAGYAHYRNMDAGPCLDHYEQAVLRYRGLRDTRGLARVLCERVRAQLTLAAVPYGTLADIEPLEQALDALPDEEVALRGQACAMIAEAYWAARLPHRAEPMAERALALGREIGDDRLCALVSSVALATTHLQRLHLHEALRSLEQGLRHARRSGDPWVLGWPLQRIPIALITLGRLADAERAVDEACDLARVTEDFAEHSLALASKLFVSVARGDLDAAERQAQESLTCARRSHYPWGAALALPGLACARALRGARDPGAVLDPLVEPGTLVEGEAPLFRLLVQVYRQLLAARAGTLELPPEKLTIRALLSGSRNLLDIDLLGLLCAGVETAQALGDAELAERCYPPLAAAAERGLVFPRSGWVFLLPRVLGVAATLGGRFSAAAAHFERAIELGGETGARPELARSYLDYACMRCERGDRGDRDAAAALLERAGPLLAELGMEPCLESTEQLAAELDVRLPPPALRERPDAQRGVSSAAEPAPRVLLITDMEGFTQLLERVGDERAQDVTHTHNVILRACLREYAGREIQHTGDGLIASFRSPTRAIRCALGIQNDLASYNARGPEHPIRVRVGLHVGETRSEEDRLFGAAVNAAARICDFAEAEQILASEAVRERAGVLRSAFRDRGAAYLKGFAQPFRLHEIVWERRPRDPARGGTARERERRPRAQAPASGETCRRSSERP